VGAFIDIIKKIVIHNASTFPLIRVMISFRSYLTIGNVTGQSYSWSSFLEEVSPRALVELLENSAGRFARGFPSNPKLQDLSIARIFAAILCEGVVTDSDCTTDDEKGTLMVH
jgi:hypothetical protein